MESIERITTAPQLDGGDRFIRSMRDFLAKPRVAREFQNLKADSQRLSSIAAERTSLTEKAAEAELEAGRMARLHEEHRRHRLSFGFGVMLASLFVLLDTIPANLAAQTFGLDPLPTWGITAVLVGALGAGMWAVTHYKSGPRRSLTIAALAVGLLSIGALRFWFLWITAGDALSALLEAAALTVFTTMMVWLGVVVLSFTKSHQVSSAEHRARVLRRRSERAAKEEVTLNRTTQAARSEFLADAQLFSFQMFES
ncbi:MAG TPA: hypothetical protein VNA65_06500, partial [Candidatus Dormibacteraeota bacterium]|nr:hypothetical protein [Candidatus Dormibacteraeota bacterium]